MNGETISMAPMPGYMDVPHEPRHAAPEIDVEALGAEAKAADEYYESQVLRQRLAEYALAYGPFEAGTTAARRVKFARDQRRILAEAIDLQIIAKNYADDKWAQISASFGTGKFYPYEGRHRKPVDVAADAQDMLVSAEPAEAEPVVSEEELLEGGKHRQPEPPAEEHPTEAVPAKRKWSIKTAWYAAGAAMSSYFANPEKGSKRQTIAVLAGYVAVATVAYLAGKRPGFSFDFWDGINGESNAPGSPGASLPTQQFYDNLQPQGYHGEAYEWGAVADDVGSANVNAHLLDMVQDARGQGAYVQTWGDTATGNWGINYVEVPLAGGGSKAYYETQNKLAILQYLSELSEHNAEANMQ